MTQEPHTLDLSQWSTSELMILDVVAAGLKAASRNCYAPLMQTAAWSVAERLQQAVRSALQTSPPRPGGQNLG